MKKLIIALLVCGLVFGLGFGKITLNFWHAMSGSRLGTVEAIVNAFNEANPGIEVVPQFTGSYAETLTKAIASVRAGNPPHIVQVYEVGLQTMLDSNAIVPLYEFADPDYDFGGIIAPILDYYTVNGKLYSMPFNSSTAILYFNKELFEKAGLDTTNPPGTFAEIMEAGKKLVDSGVCAGGISFGWPAWIFEQMHSYHGFFYSNNENGRTGRSTEVFFNQPFGVDVMAEWIRWAQAGVFLYGGREYDANQAFLTGQIAMLIQSTSSVGSIEAKANFPVGTTFLPRLEGYPRGNSVIGGATLWTMKGHSDEEYDAIWKFYEFLTRTDMSTKWHKETGYFPSTNDGVKKLMNEGWFSTNPNHLTAFLQILSGQKMPESQGVVLGNFVTIRDIVDSAVETAVQYKGSDPEKEAQRILDEAAAKTNQVLKDYVMMFGE
ncbi:MAG TPA: ABC transporter substrate-binding protein [Thermotogota bacterium]|nr:ABC transporter substrate-binding protein [Thermotogota bacterium]HRW93570.1 ABC transporter substrate-binding protein [Thermotogota bacterium]